MTLYEERPPRVEASQWFKNGDHPEDNSVEIMGSEGPFLSEGKVVRRYRTPDLDGQQKCEACGDIMHNHGWLDVASIGKIVCPGDWVVLGFLTGTYYTFKPDVFEFKYRKSE